MNGAVHPRYPPLMFELMDLAAYRSTLPVMQDDASSNPSTRFAAEVAAIREIRFDHSPLFPTILASLKLSLLVSSRHAGKLIVVGTHQGHLQASLIDLEGPLGIAYQPGCLAISTAKQIQFWRAAHHTQGQGALYDGCFIARSSHYTGGIEANDLAWGRTGLWIANTKFSSLCTLHEDYSFVPQWRPPFLSQLVDQDRCHLNGLAIRDGDPKYVSAHAISDEPAGWQSQPFAAGVILELPTGKLVCNQLSMPNSPRYFQERLWVLNAGCGELGFVDFANHSLQTIASLPGFTRGLSLYDRFAFVGLSKVSPSAQVHGVPITENCDALHCGIGIIDLTNGNTVAVMQFRSGIDEVDALELLPGFNNPLLAGTSQRDQRHEIWIVPSDSEPRPTILPRFPIFSSVNHPPDSTEPTRLPDSASESVTVAMATVSQLRSQGRLAEAAKAIERVIAIAPSPANLLVELGNLRQDQNNQHSALLCYQRALESDPTCIVALQNLGYLLFNMGEAEKSRDVYDQLLALAPSPLNHLLAAAVLPVVYDSNADIDYWRQHQLALLRQLVASGQKVDATKSLVPTNFFSAYQGCDNRQIAALRGQVIQGGTFTSKKLPSRSIGRVHLGVLSAYFRDHTIGRLNIRRLENLSRDQIHLTIIHAGLSNDNLIKRFMATADRYVTLARDPSTAIDTLTSLDLDILLYADIGMDALTQSLAYSRFAPIQIATWGHPDTTGSPAIDYFLSSDALETETSPSSYTEKLLKLPSLGIDYDRPTIQRPKSRRELGLPVDKHLYGCPQTLFKLHPDFDAILARILANDPLGELILLEGRLSEWTHRLRRRFRRTIPDADHRIHFLPSLPRDDYLSLLKEMDVLLDPIHFGGGNSSIESITMGTPVVTMEGEYLRSRITSALLNEIGLPELITKDTQSYSDLAVTIGCDAAYRDVLRNRILTAADTYFQKTNAAQELEACLLGLLQDGQTQSGDSIPRC